MKASSRKQIPGWKICCFHYLKKKSPTIAAVAAMAVLIAFGVLFLEKMEVNLAKIIGKEPMVRQLECPADVRPGKSGLACSKKTVKICYEDRVHGTDAKAKTLREA